VPFNPPRTLFDEVDGPLGKYRAVILLGFFPTVYIFFPKFFSTDPEILLDLFGICLPLKLIRYVPCFYSRPFAANIIYDLAIPMSVRFFLLPFYQVVYGLLGRAICGSKIFICFFTPPMRP